MARLPWTPLRVRDENTPLLVSLNLELQPGVFSTTKVLRFGGRYKIHYCRLVRLDSDGPSD